MLNDKNTIYYIVNLERDKGRNKNILSQLPGKTAIGHVRYSTTGESKPENLQPLFANLAIGGFACAHNGNLTNTSKYN